MTNKKVVMRLEDHQSWENPLLENVNIIKRWEDQNGSMTSKKGGNCKLEIPLKMSWEGLSVRPGSI